MRIEVNRTNTSRQLKATELKAGEFYIDDQGDLCFAVRMRDRGNEEGIMVVYCLRHELKGYSTVVLSGSGGRTYTPAGAGTTVTLTGGGS